VTAKPGPVGHPGPGAHEGPDAHPAPRRRRFRRLPPDVAAPPAIGGFPPFPGFPPEARFPTCGAHPAPPLGTSSEPTPLSARARPVGQPAGPAPAGARSFPPSPLRVGLLRVPAHAHPFSGVRVASDPGSPRPEPQTPRSVRLERDRTPPQPGAERRGWSRSSVDHPLRDRRRPMARGPSRPAPV